MFSSYFPDLKEYDSWIKIECDADLDFNSALSNTINKIQRYYRPLKNGTTEVATLATGVGVGGGIGLTGFAVSMALTGPIGWIAAGAFGIAGGLLGGAAADKAENETSHHYIFLDCENYWISLDWVKTSNLLISVSLKKRLQNESSLDKETVTIHNKTVKEFIRNVVIDKFLALNK